MMRAFSASYRMANLININNIIFRRQN
ncbi:hypothetical protein CBM2608_B30108 [Cupriavidus taiwanensis]|nr:hypothetical protein CBM2608_B30108 [Cupriavidus taiwanensis]